jgi:hypothetical protein
VRKIPHNRVKIQVSNMKTNDNSKSEPMKMAKGTPKAKKLNILWPLSTCKDRKQ